MVETVLWQRIVEDKSSFITLFLCGDVMLGRGIDQILPHPCPPTIYEGYMKSAIGYVELAEHYYGTISKPKDFPYVWGDALKTLEYNKPDARIINLETSVTRSEKWEPKGINYRMSPENVPCITAAKIDCCVLANNHVLDWGYTGLQETLQSLRNANLKISGAGENIKAAESPAILPMEKGRVLVFSFAMTTSGVPHSWAATDSKSGVNFLPDLNMKSINRIQELVSKFKKSNDVAIFSIHWGPNWGYEIEYEERWFAHQLIDFAGMDIIHGHSSHHFKGIEVYKNKLILYGCGDFVNDYEGIKGFEEYRDDLTLMYFPKIDLKTGELVSLKLIPKQIRKFTLNNVEKSDMDWVRNVLNREGKLLGTHFNSTEDGSLLLKPTTEKEP